MKQWIKNHPFVSVFLATMFVFVTTTYWMFYLLREPFSRFDVALYLAFLIGCWIVVRGARKKATMILLAGTLMISPAKAEEEFKPAAAYAIGGAFVLIVGGIIYYKAVKKCEKISKSRTNSWPEELNCVVAGAQDEYGAAFFWPEEYCAQERGNGTNEIAPVRFTMTIFVEATNCTMRLAADGGSQVVESFDECKEWAASHGLFVPDSPRFSESYARNLQPVPAEIVPIKFDWTTRTATVKGGGITLVVESSNDLKTWRPLASLNVAAGSEVEIPDVSTERRFYRVVTR